MNKRFLQSLQLYLGIMDISSIAAIFFTIHYLFRQYGLIGVEIQYIYFGFFLSVIWLGVVLLMRIYQEKDILSFEQFTRVSLRAYTYFLLTVILYLFFFRLIVLSRIFIVTVLLAIAVMIVINRFIYLLLLHYFRKKDYFSSKVIIIGYNSLSKRLAGYLEEEGIKKEIIGFCEEYENVDELSNYPVLGQISEALETCKKHGITEIYSTIAPEHNSAIYSLMQNADQHCIRFKIVPDLGFFVKKHIHIDYLGEMPVISVRNEPLEDLGNRIKKRAFDLLVSGAVILFILVWLIPLVSLLIWLESRGPVFFMQERTGKDNKRFGCLKFRSMRVNAGADVLQASRNDGRITRLGRFLRRTNLDEFPQFLNVFLGQMSVVGPRPHMLKHTYEYSQLIGQYMVRQFLKPGITGWAQVNGFRGETKDISQMQRRVEHDLWYMENWSLMFDLRIIFMTLLNTFKGEKNAY